MGSFSKLPPDVLRSITRLLPVQDLLKLSRLSGNRSLMRNCAFGGVTELVSLRGDVRELDLLFRPARFPF